MQRFTSFDGTAIAYQRLGQGRPILLLHGLFSSGQVNWVKYGAAAEIIAAGFEAIIPDLRGHGASDKPHDPARWPVDVLAQDIEALIAHLDLKELDIAGYSLGARTSVRLLARGLRPRRAVLAGMGLAGITGGAERAAFFLKVLAGGEFRPGTAEFAADAFLRQNEADRVAITHLLHAQRSTPLDVVRSLDTRILVVCGEADHDNGSGEELALALPQAAFVQVPGNHMSAVTRPDFGAAIAGWLGH